MKDREIALARRMIEKLAQRARASTAEGVRLAVLGNVIDFFKPFDVIE